MNLSSSGLRKSVMNELCEDRKEHESKTLRLMRGSFVLSDDMDCENNTLAFQHIIVIQ